MPQSYPEMGSEPVTEDDPAPQMLQAQVLPEWAGQRIDAVAARCFQQYSRENLKNWLASGYLQVNGQQPKPSWRVTGGEQLLLTVPELPAGTWQPQAMPLDIVHSDPDYWVICKPAGLIVHPGHGNPDGTLVNGLLALDPRQASLPRAGLVHRLDKDTTGLLVVARTLTAQQDLSRQLLEKSVYRLYDALVWGTPPARGRIDLPLDRHPVERTRMAVRPDGRPAVTHYRRLGQFGPVAWLRLQLETGRTHQIRVHVAHQGWHMVGDPVYGRSNPPRSELPRGLFDQLNDFPRQALHARELGFRHPVSQQPVQYQAEPPADWQALLQSLRDWAST